MDRNSEPRFPKVIEAAAARWIARRDAGLSPEGERELAAWLAADPRHPPALEFHAATWHSLGRPAATGQEIALRSYLGRLATRRRTRRRVAGAISAAAMLALGIVYFRLPSTAPSPAPSGSIAQLVVPARQVLPDGSVAELKEAARITVEFTSRRRRVALEVGEVHFTVKPDATRPFIVSVAGIDVRAVGTAFSVRKNDSAIEVLVTHGTVALDKDSTPTLATLHAGSMAHVPLAADPVPQVRSVAPAEQSQRLAWRGPRLEFTRTPLSEAVQLFNQHAQPGAPRLAVGDPEVAARRVSGVFRADNSEAFVTLLEGAFDVKAEREGDIFVLRSAL